MQFQNLREMNHQLLIHFGQCEAERVKLMRELSAYPESMLDHKPSPERWSVNQILIHLLTSEQLTLAYLKKKSLGVDQVKDAGPRESLKIFLLILSQRLPMKFKAPAVVLAHTPATVPLESLAAQWEILRREMQDFLETIRDEHLKRLIYKHPVAGRLDVIQCLTFMREHFLHHLRQIKLLL